jgi:cytidine deaminase
MDSYEQWDSYEVAGGTVTSMKRTVTSTYIETVTFETVTCVETVTYFFMGQLHH